MRNKKVVLEYTYKYQGWIFIIEPIIGSLLASLQRKSSTSNGVLKKWSK